MDCATLIAFAVFGVELLFYCGAWREGYNLLSWAFYLFAGWESYYPGRLAFGFENTEAAELDAGIFD